MRAKVNKCSGKIGMIVKYPFAVCELTVYDKTSILAELLSSALSRTRNRGKNCDSLPFNYF